MSNPYISPSFDPKQFQDYSAPFPPPQNTGFGWVQQIRVVAILNCVQGGLECTAGAAFTGLGIFAGVMIGMERQGRGMGNGPPGGPPPGMEWILGGIYTTMGVVALAAGILRLYAGIQNFRYRKRTLGLVSFFCGLGSMSVCYCAPTGIGMLIYGLIVYLNPAVKLAFDMGDKGASPDAILNSFLPYPPPGYGQPPFSPPPTTPYQPPFSPPPSPPPT
jgi:hypothetical protein